MRLLLIEDDEVIRSTLERDLQRVGFAVDCAVDGERGEFLGSTEQYVYGLDADPDSNVIEVYINRLRQKLGKDLIQTRRGQGMSLIERGRHELVAASAEPGVVVLLGGLFLQWFVADRTLVFVVESEMEKSSATRR